MSRRAKAAQPTGKVLLLVDDNLDYLQLTRTMLEGEGHTVLWASNGPEALALLQQCRVDLLLLDYYMPGMTGAEVVRQVREFNPYVQVVLQTGYASERPPREILRSLDIQGYFDKSEGTEKLLLWVDVGLKAAYTIQLLYKSRLGLKYILEATPELHKIQPLDDLLQGVLLQVTELLGTIDSFLAVLPESDRFDSKPNGQSFLALADDEAELVVRAATGQYTIKTKVMETLADESLDLVLRALREGRLQTQDSMAAVPLQVGEATIGLIFLNRSIFLEQQEEMLQLFANQAAVAIQNSQLYELAAYDLLTGVYVRRFFLQLLIRELRTAFRAQTATALLMMDLDGLKRLNDTAGHQAGDQALALMGKVLRRVTRGCDVIGRYGGDEFVVLLPSTDLAGAKRVGERILEALREQSLPDYRGDLRVHTSIGLALLDPNTAGLVPAPCSLPRIYFEELSTLLIHRADETLYKAKTNGGDCLWVGDSLQWRPPLQAHQPMIEQKNDRP